MAVSPWTLIWASTQPILKVVLLCSVGVVCARKGILDYKGKKILSSLCYLVFIPALNFTSLGASITPSRLVHWWPLPLNVFLSHAMGGILGVACVKTIKHEPWFRRHVIAALMFGNTGNLPLVIVSTLARTSAQILGGVDPSKAEAVAVSYVVVGLIVSILLVPTVGYRLLAKQSGDGGPDKGSRADDQEGCENGGGSDRAFEGADEQTWLLADATGSSAALGQSLTDRPGGAAHGRAEGMVDMGMAAGGTATSNMVHGPNSAANGGGSHMQVPGGRLQPAHYAIEMAAGLSLDHAPSLGAWSPAEGAELLAPLPPSGSPGGAGLGPGPAPGASPAARSSAESAVTAVTLRSPAESAAASSGQAAKDGMSADKSIALGAKRSLSFSLDAVSVDSAVARAGLLQTSTEAGSRHSDGGKDTSRTSDVRWGTVQPEAGRGPGLPHLGQDRLSGLMLYDAARGAHAQSPAPMVDSSREPAGPSDGRVQSHQRLMLSRFTPEFLSRAPSPEPLSPTASPRGDRHAAFLLAAVARGAQAEKLVPEPSSGLARSSTGHGRSRMQVLLSRFTPDFLSPAQSPVPSLPTYGHKPSTPDGSPHRNTAASESLGCRHRPGSTNPDPESGALQTSAAATLASTGDQPHDQPPPPPQQQQQQQGQRQRQGQRRQPQQQGLQGLQGHPVPTPPLLNVLVGRRCAAAMAVKSRDVVLLLLKELLSPPILATLIAIFIGCIRPLQALFFGVNAPLSLVTGAIQMLSACAIPTMMVGLGATLANGPGAAKVPLRTILSVSILRLLVLPLLGLLIVIGGYSAGAYHAPDAVFLLVMLLQNTAPTAILVHTMSAVHQNYDAEVSTLLFWQYLVSIATSPPYIALFLLAVGRAYRPDDAVPT